MKRNLPTYQEVAAECWSIQEGIKNGKVKVVDAVERCNAIGKLLSAAKQYTVDWMLTNRTGGAFQALLKSDGEIMAEIPDAAPVKKIA